MFWVVIKSLWPLLLIGLIVFGLGGFLNRGMDRAQAAYPPRRPGPWGSRGTH